jgi:hypothetical protein
VHIAGLRFNVLPTNLSILQIFGLFACQKAPLREVGWHGSVIL